MTIQQVIGQLLTTDPRLSLPCKRAQAYLELISKLDVRGPRVTWHRLRDTYYAAVITVERAARELLVASGMPKREDDPLAALIRRDAVAEAEDAFERATMLFDFVLTKLRVPLPSLKTTPRLRAVDPRDDDYDD